MGCCGSGGSKYPGLSRGVTVKKAASTSTATGPRHMGASRQPVTPYVPKSAPVVNSLMTDAIPKPGTPPITKPFEPFKNVFGVFRRKKTEPKKP